MSFGFSVTDFVKAIELVAALGDALRATGDARLRFRDLISELHALENSLLEVKRLKLDDDLEEEQRALRSAASQCQISIDNFWKKTSKLQPHMQISGTGSIIKDSWAKVKWALCKKEDVEQFRATIRGHTGSINILLHTVQLKASTKQLMVLDLHGKRQDEEHKGITGKIQYLTCQVMSKLDEVSKTIAETVQQGRVLLEISTKVVKTNIRVYSLVKEVYVLMRTLPAQIERQQPIIFTDAFNRIRPFHLEFVRSEEAFLSILRHDFEEMQCDARLLDQHRYVLDESGTGSRVDESLSWDLRLKPGQAVGMSMVFKRREEETTSCPQCHKEEESATDKEITCNNCKTIYRRVQELQPRNPRNEISATSAVGASEQSGGRKRKRLGSSYDIPEVAFEGADCDATEAAQMAKFRRLQIIEAMAAKRSRRMYQQALDGNSFGDGPEYSIFVGGLGPEVNEYVLDSLFQNKFPSCKSAKIMSDPISGISRGYGFVHFTEEGEQQRALTEMQGVYCGNRPMRISTATPRTRADQGRPDLVQGIEPMPTSEPKDSFDHTTSLRGTIMVEPELTRRSSPASGVDRATLRPDDFPIDSRQPLTDDVQRLDALASVALWNDGVVDDSKSLQSELHVHDTAGLPANGFVTPAGTQLTSRRSPVIMNSTISGRPGPSVGAPTKGSAWAFPDDPNDSLPDDEDISEEEFDESANLRAARDREYIKMEILRQQQLYGHDQYTPPVTQRYGPPLDAQAVPMSRSTTPLSHGGYPPQRDMLARQSSAQRAYEFEQEQRRREYERERSREIRNQQAADEAEVRQKHEGFLRHQQEQAEYRRYPEMQPR